MDGTIGLTQRPPELDAVRRRRAELHDALGDLAGALDSEGADVARWLGHLCAAVDRLASEFALHVEVTEGPDGLHQAILAGDLRLANQVAALVAEHRTIAADIAGLMAATDLPTGDVAALRAQGTAVSSRIVRHRQRGADLIFEAYQTDIGGGD